ncbi:MAG: Crp/Fnr family transcriptional regulator [Campylobacterales bacterium]|nr:Crp/Fnr family transcriptional regulator [Campylobacterales bacterium]
MQTLETIKKIPLFESLEKEQIETLASLASIVNFKEGEGLFTQGDICENILILIDGVVSIYKHTDKGDEVVIGYFHRYALLAEAATLRHSPLPSSARFHTDGAILRIPLNEFEKFLLLSPKLSYAIILSLLEKVDLLQQNIHFNLASNAKEKVLNFYAKNSKLAQDLKRYEIASILGVTPETLSRMTKQLIKEGRLIQSNRSIKAL